MLAMPFSKCALAFVTRMSTGVRWRTAAIMMRPSYSTCLSTITGMRRDVFRWYSAKPDLCAAI